MSELFTRYGTPAEGTVQRDGKGRPFVMMPRACGRCGGAGGAQKWEHTGWTCFDCGGSGKHRNGPQRVSLYTVDQIGKLNAAKAKRDAKRRAVAEAKAAAAQAAAEARRESFYRTHGDLLARCEPFCERSEFVRDVCRRASEQCSLTDGQTAALESTIAKIAAEDARRAAASYIGKIGERVKNIRATAINLHTIDHGAYSGNFSRYFYITTLRTDDGNTIVVKSSSFYAQKGEVLILSGTVKDHTTYNGERQTQLERVKATDPKIAKAA